MNVHAEHVPGVENVAADALSRDNVVTFLQVVPEAERYPTPIPEALVDLTVREQPDWTSPHCSTPVASRSSPIDTAGVRIWQKEILGLLPGVWRSKNW